MKTVKEKTRFFIKPKDPVVPDKWTLLRRLAQKQISESAQLKLEWIIFYHIQSGKNAKQTANHFGISRKTFHKWLARFDDKNLKSLEEESRAPVHVRTRQIDLWERGRIIKSRKRHLKWGKMKLQKRYIKEYGEYISSWKIQKVIEEENLYPDKELAKKQRIKRNRHKGQLKKRITQFQKKKIINHLWHVDTVLLTLSSGGYRYLLTAIDEVSKLAYARLYSTHSSKQAKDFLERLIYLTNHQIINLHHDNGAEFKKDFEAACVSLKLPQWYSRPHTPKDNPVLERFNRTIQDEFVNFQDVDPEDIQDFNHQLLDWLIEYNNVRPHQSLAYQTPLEYIETRSLGVLLMYSSHTTGDDGVRVYIDGERIIDGWRGQPPTTYSAYKTLTAGNHTIVMEYFEWGGGASAKLEYNQLSTPANTQTAFGYDALMRLISASYPNSNSYSYTYDKVGNRLTSTKQGTQTTYTYNNDNQLTNQGSITYSYDNNGNRLTSITSGVGKSYVYNFENKLTNLIHPATNTNLNFIYDGRGNRIAEKSGSIFNMKYVNDTSGELTRVMHTVDSSNTQTNYVYGPSGLVSQGKEGYLDRKYYLEDGLGNIRYVTDATSNNIQTYAYDAFGNSTLGGPASKFQYKGEEVDSTGLYFMRARYYDPLTGGFISKDPVEGYSTKPETQNGYNFVNHNPVNLSDPTGLDIYGVCAGANAAIPVYGTCSVCANYSTNEKKFFPSATFGFGGSTGFALGAGASGLYSNAQSVNDYRGQDIFGGFSAGEGVEVNGDVSVSKNNPNIRSYSLGLGLGVNLTFPVLPGEAHGGISNTW